MSGQPWDDPQDAQLRALWATGMSAKAIGVAMGRSKSSIIGRAHRLDLEGRPSPIRPFTSAGECAPSARHAEGAPSARHAEGAPSARRKAASGDAPPNLRARNAPAPKVTLPPIQRTEPPLAPPREAPQAPVVIFKPRPPARCTWPMWGAKTKFDDDGNPLLCGDPATEGPYCEEHRKVAFVRAPRARAMA
jgi:GcrA cell cycle regulator